MRQAARFHSFDTVLIANRGEVAMRVIRSARKLGLRTVAVYSDADVELPHSRSADRAVRIGPAPATDSYLSIERLIGAAHQSGAQAIHPGYGFLSESEEFALACREAGLVFVGPSPEAIRSMGNKPLAKQIMTDRGVPCIPGYDGVDQSDARMMREAERIGLPLMIKAAAGGGGKGMRLVKSLADLPEALHSARSEALKSFGNSALMLERAVIGARHVEIQIFGDRYGNLVYIGDRDCSVQRRHQKIIEEAPAPGLSQSLRDRMGAAAVSAGHAVQYEGAGTVEFLVRGDEFFFLEMNTRLQVEHPVTEMVTGIDLVEWQFRIAEGEELPLAQHQIHLNGHAIEARVYAEDPAADFLPQSGRVLIWHPPEEKGIRIDHGICTGAIVSTHYDPMIAKVITFASDRELARRKLAAATQSFAIGGVRSNLTFLRQCLLHPEFVRGGVDTGFLNRNSFNVGRSVPDRKMIALAAALFQQRAVKDIDPSLASWRSRPWNAESLPLTSGDWQGIVEIGTGPGGLIQVRDPEGMISIKVLTVDESPRICVNGIDQTVHQAWRGDELHLVCDDQYECFAVTDTEVADKSEAGAAIVRSPMPGNIREIRVSPGARVQTDEILMILESMKMELLIRSPLSGTIINVSVAVGQQVGLRTAMVEIVGDEVVT